MFIMHTFPLSPTTSRVKATIHKLSSVIVDVQVPVHRDKFL